MWIYEYSILNYVFSGSRIIDMDEGILKYFVTCIHRRIEELDGEDDKNENIFTICKKFSTRTITSEYFHSVSSF